MAEMHDRFDTRLRQVHKQQRQYDNTRKKLKAYFEANPRRAAQALLLSLPAQLDVWRQHAISRLLWLSERAMALCPGPNA